jgi:hypothetical protein
MSLSRAKFAIFSNKKEMHGIISSAFHRVFKAINICRNYTNNDTQIAIFLSYKIEKNIPNDLISFQHVTVNAHIWEGGRV